jgi:hypothetical protein
MAFLAQHLSLPSTQPLNTKYKLIFIQFIWSNSDVYLNIAMQCLFSRLWKDHLKNYLRSDQDHRQKIDLRSRSHVFKNMILDQDQDQRSNFAPKVPFLGVIF